MWSAIERFGNQGIQFVIGLVLARLLSPADYGLVGMLLIFISIAQIFVEGGFSAALIRKISPSQTDYSTAFWFNLTASFILYSAICVCSPFIAGFYNEPMLVPLAKIIGLNIIISAFGIIQKTILTKELDFKVQTKINISSIVVSGLIGLFVAWRGYGVWALVAQNLSRTFFMNTALWFFSNWRPQIVFSKSSFQELFGFGSKLLLSGLINTVSENLYAIVIGKLYSAKSLGFYTRANQFQKLPVSSIYGAVSAVSYPVLSELQNSDQKLKDGFRSMIRLVSFVLFPIMAILGSVSVPMISLILTDKWLPSAPILQIICVSGSFYPIHAINLDILKVKGRSDLFLVLEIIKQILNIVVIYLCYKSGIYGLLVGAVCLNIFCLYLNSFYTKSLIGYSFLDLLKDLAATFFASLLTVAFIQALFLFISNQYIQLSIFPVLGLVFYLLMAHVLSIKELYLLKAMVSNMLYKKTISVN